MIGPTIYLRGINHCLMILDVRCCDESVIVEGSASESDECNKRRPSHPSSAARPILNQSAIDYDHRSVRHTRLVLHRLPRKPLIIPCLDPAEDAPLLGFIPGRPRRFRLPLPRAPSPL